MKIIMGLMLLVMMSCVSSTEATTSDPSDPQYWHDMLLPIAQPHSTLTNDQLFEAFNYMIYNISTILDLIKKGDKNEDNLTRTAQHWVSRSVDYLDYMMECVISQENGYQVDCGDFSKTDVAERMRYMIDSKVIDRVIALDPTSGKMWRDKGTILEWLGDYEEAGDCFINASQGSMNNEAQFCYNAEANKRIIISDGLWFYTSHAVPLETFESLDNKSNGGYCIGGGELVK